MILEAYCGDEHQMTIITDHSDIDDIIDHVNEVLGSNNWESVRIYNEKPNGLPEEEV